MMFTIRKTASPSASCPAPAALRENAASAERRRREPERARFQRLPTRNSRSVRRVFERRERFGGVRGFLSIPFHGDSPFIRFFFNAAPIPRVFVRLQNSVR
jgi:hypothetical protein